MFKFSFKKRKHNEFKHIAHGLIPAASVAPKPGLPRTPPPRSPDPSPERPRSALAAAILSSSLTGQTWALPPARPRSFSESDRSESLIYEPNNSTAFYTRWSETLDRRLCLSSPDHTEEELEDKEEVDNEDEREERVYQSLDKEDIFLSTGPVCSLPQKPKITTPQKSQMSDTRLLSTAVQTTVQLDQTSHAKNPAGLSPEPSKAHRELQRELAQSLLEKNTNMAERQKLQEERLQRLEQEISHSKASPNLRSSSGSQAELLNLRQHAQELVDENDALKLTVHRLNVELSHYQTLYRPLSKRENSKISGLPKTGSPPPWLLDMKYLSPLLLAYEDRMKEQDTLLQTTEEQVRRLRAHVEEVIKENEQLHDEVAKLGGLNLKDCHQLQEQAFLVLQENQILIEQLETQHVKAKANHNRHQSEVSNVSKQLILLEAEKHRLQEDLEESRKDLQKNKSEIQVLQARLKETVPWDEHCSIAGKLRRQMGQQESSTRSEMEELLCTVSGLQEESRRLALHKANLTADIKRMEADLKLSRQANRKAERKMSVLKQQKEASVLKEEKTRHCLEAVFSVAEHISRERDQLLHMVSALQQEKRVFINKILNGTVRFGKLQEDVQVYRSQASTRLAAMEEAAKGRTASYQKEILHLQRLLRERQEAEERLLQSKREVEEELEILWQAATRENHQIKEALLNSRLTADLHNWALSCSASLGWLPPPSKGTTQVHTHSSEK